MEREAFYTVAAQVIPVLLLVLILESRLQPRLIRGRRAYNVRTLISVLVIWIFIALGEALALTNLWRGKEIEWAAPVVLFAVLLELVAVLALAFIAWAYPAERDI